jgi:hypothetical protein
MVTITKARTPAIRLNWIAFITFILNMLGKLHLKRLFETKYFAAQYKKIVTFNFAIFAAE